MRLFIAIEIPDEPKAEIFKLKTDIKGIRWIRPEQIHLTLAFLGELDNAICDKLVQKLSEIKFECFEMHLTGCGFFPNINRASVFWIGAENHTALERLKANIDSVLCECDIPIEDRAFKPHVTIARISNVFPQQLAKIAKKAQHFDAKFNVDSFRLFSSELTPSGAIHSVVAEFKAKS